MRIAAFTVSNYRSIVKAERIDLGDYTVFIGPNNEGKSNLIRGLVAGMRVLRLWGSRPPIPTAPSQSRPAVTRARAALPRAMVQRIYNWDDDYPRSLQQTTPGGRTTLSYEFELTQDEIAEFKDEVGSRLNGILPVRLSLAANGTVGFEVIKRGPGKDVLQKKPDVIARFISRRLEFYSIPAVRTMKSIEDIVADLIELEFDEILDSPEYAAAVASIEAARRPALERVEALLRDTLATYLPQVNSVQVELREPEALMRPRAITVDDGVATDLANKGDGVKSLAAISLMQHVASASARARAVVLAVEEPEAHLHPDAVHEIRQALIAISERQQVIITTHSPILANRQDLAANVIVEGGSTRRCRSRNDIRRSLGVRVSDNLSSAEGVLIVEGAHDELAVMSVARAMSSSVDEAASDGRLVVVVLRGASRLSAQVGAINDQFCGVHVLLDHDQEGRNAFQDAVARQLLTPAQVTFTTSAGMSESEFEDWVKPACYETVLRNKYGVVLDDKFLKRKAKWSDRMTEAFHRCGKAIDEPTLRDVKGLVANAVANEPATALRPEWSQAATSLVASLEALLRG